MRNKTVDFAGKKIRVEEKRIGELEKLVADIFPGSKGKLSNIDKALEGLEMDWELIYKLLPKVFPDITKEDIRNAYMSEIEELVKAFIDVNFFGLKKLMGGLMRLNPIISQQR